MELKRDTLIRCKGVEISIGKRIDQVAIISTATDDFVPFTSIKKGGRLAKVKRIFSRNLSSSTHFFFEGMDEKSTIKLISIFK